jgi:alpha-D-ribose 1-methylphosphonate 5-triphosphate diphosphatase
MGGPNVVRGGSHTGSGMSARDHARRGSCTVLASDYYYPSQMLAALSLVTDGDLPMGAAWNLVSRNPARAVGLDDRGELAPGRRADLILVDVAEPARPRLLATVVGGRRVHQREEAARHFASAALAV